MQRDEGFAQENRWNSTVWSDVPLRPKPRGVGRTMVIDQGLGPAETVDWLALTAEYVDFVKFGFGTALLYAPEVLRRKVEAMVRAGVAVLPGGTLLEIAFFENRTTDFFDLARTAGFTHVEVSDGTIALPRMQRNELIRRAKHEGFGVLTEVGKKDADRPLDPEHALDQIALDLEAGADIVIVEARATGHGVGIFDAEGRLREDLFEDMVDGLEAAGRVMWEAPLPSQQKALLIRLGPDVSLGNVYPHDVFTLEAMRRGLRGDTLRQRLDAWTKQSHTRGGPSRPDGGDAVDAGVRSKI